MIADFADVQRIVLHGTRWTAARHLMLTFGDKSPLHFLKVLLKQDRPTAATGPTPDLQFSLGFTRRGLERAAVPDVVLARFALKAPAYWAGAALRAASHLGMSDRNASERWDPWFRSLDAVLSVHAKQAGKELDEVLALLAASAKVNGLTIEELPPAAALTVPPDFASHAGEPARGQWVHFGFLDGLSRIGIRGWTLPKAWEQCLPVSRHEAGEFLLGHLQDSGADPWVAGPRQSIWPDKVRAFFRNGSFGVLQQIEQDVSGFERFVKETSKANGLSPDEIKGKLCGRFPDGRSLAVPGHEPADDFDYGADSNGHGCPFGSHVRRMNPRLPRDDAPMAAADGQTEPDERPAHFSRARPLLRRGMPYGPAAWTPQTPGEENRPRGLIGQFFCASIEDQYEHLLGEWAERVPMGSPDGGGARDPLIGAHETGDGPFEIPRANLPALHLDGMTPFTRTIGAAYLFYPSLTTLAGIADSSLWGLDDEDDDEDGDE
jgi:hypothetical protein